MQTMISDIRKKIPGFGETIATNGEGVYPRLNAAEGIYNGTPNDQDLARIREVIGGAAEADDFVVYCYNAFSNVICMDFNAFSPSVVAQFAGNCLGKSFLTNHDWGDIGASKGTIIQSALYRTDDVPVELKRELPNYKNTKALVKAQGGYYWAMVKIAVPSNSPMAQGLADGSINRGSIGASTFDGRIACPDCSEKHGRYVGFWEVDEDATNNSKDGEVVYMCPHTALNSWNLFWAEWMDRTDVNWSKATLIDASMMPVEYSAVVYGMVPGSMVIRN